MNIDELAFFDNLPNEFEMYETILDRLSRFGYEYSIRVQKTQISLSNQYMFACVSFARVKKKAELPPHYLVVTFGLNYKILFTFFFRSCSVFILILL